MPNDRKETGSIRERVAELASPAKLNGEPVIATVGPRLRRRLRHMAESGLYWAGLASAFAWVKRLNGAKILMYHSVAASDEADWIDPRNNTTPDIFRRQIEFLARHRHVVSLSELVRAIECGENITGGTVVITFDDGYTNALRVATPIVAEFKLPMTLFLSTGYVGGHSAPWIDRLYTMFRMRTQEQLCLGWSNFGPRNLRNVEERTEIYRALVAILVSANALEREQILAEVENQLKPTAKPPRLLFDWNEVRRLVREFPNVEIGAHTVEHVDLSGCTRDQATEEILGSMVDIERELGLRPAHFSYPYGRMSPAAHDLPGKLGLHSALVTGPADRVTSASDRFALPRLEPPRSMSRFRFLTSAAYPYLSRLLAGQVRRG